VARQLSEKWEMRNESWKSVECTVELEIFFCLLLLLFFFFLFGFSHVMQFISWIKEERQPNKKPKMPWKMKSGASDNWNINLSSLLPPGRMYLMDSGRRDTAAEMKKKLSIKRQNVDYYLECSGACSLIIILRFIRELQRRHKSGRGT